MIISTISEDSGLRVLRDDLYPFLGGGNKGRKMNYIGADILAKQANAIVTTGGIQSNHCRAATVFAAQNQIQCTLVLHGSQKLFQAQSGNAKIMRDSGAECIFVVQPDDIAAAMDSAMESYRRQGSRPYYLYGGGHTSEGGLAYIDAVADLKAYCLQQSWTPDYIFLASGTGSTQAGILAGLTKFKLKSQVVGISVGRKSQQAENIVSSFYNELCRDFNITSQSNVVKVLDDYLCGGYGKYNNEIERISGQSIKNYGFTLDTTYTAKAFYGMREFIKLNRLESKNILFWHTGGVFNYLAE